jgi:glycine/D-amino acid oxidase-like deaminating enzyme
LFRRVAQSFSSQWFSDETEEAHDGRGRRMGIAGLSCAYRLSQSGRRITLFEANSYLAGHGAQAPKEQCARGAPALRRRRPHAAAPWLLGYRRRTPWKVAGARWLHAHTKRRARS